MKHFFLIIKHIIFIIILAYLEIGIKITILNKICMKIILEKGIN
jgi:hypothetical protein